MVKQIRFALIEIVKHLKLFRVTIIQILLRFCRLVFPLFRCTFVFRFYPRQLRRNYSYVYVSDFQLSRQLKKKYKKLKTKSTIASEINR